MFVRVKEKTNSKKAVQLVASIRYGKSVRQKIIRHIGIAVNEDQLEKLIELGEVLKAQLQSETQLSLFTPEKTAQMVMGAKKNKAQAEKQYPLKIDLSKLSEEQRVVTGIHKVYGMIYKELGLHKVLPKSAYHSSHPILFNIVMARIANPKSKAGSVKLLEQDFGTQINLERVYRMMDQLTDEKIERIKSLACKKVQQLFQKNPFDSLFFDCTTLYFESFTEDELKQKGYSKDAKFKESQVILALMVTQEGLPINYEVFPGSRFEGHTLIPLIENMRSKYNLKRVVCVADRGMFNSNNIKALEDANIHYIVGAKLKKLPKEQQDILFNKSKYQKKRDSYNSRTISLDYKDQRLVVGYSAQRAKKDHYDRQQALDKLAEKLDKSSHPKELLNNYGYKKFLQIKGKTKIMIDQDKVKDAKKWDGLHGVMTSLSEKEMSNAKVFEHYRGLWQVEETFRISKHDLKVRPIFHFKPSRIKAHIAIAFMTLLCVRYLAYRMKIQYKPLSPEVIRNTLIHVQHSILKHKETGECYVIPSKMDDIATKIYSKLGVTATTTPFKL